ncbi:DUF4365 domain-containing protein [Nocardia yunnanensis]|uniref:DUF4365 domain-containing protein n=1 Tax=Nocardia yunnanensis TaxID=2382165 RepID=A0A386ZJN0_9NOCA|nr:DUF4365 domain-containing protein [Nocardia yunnanensis]AYF77636.1 DUF4365 domain-containing protein [Nocardia yunnanensis]
MFEVDVHQGLEQNNQQGQFGADYVRVLASAAGLIWSQDVVDMDGVDLCLKLPGRTARGFSPRIDVQVKTSVRLVNRDGWVLFNGLKEPQFNRLAGPDFSVPRYLFVVSVPRQPVDYTDLYTSGLLLRYIGYYLSLADLKPVTEPDRRRTRSVRIPASNILTAATLRALVTETAELPTV